MGPPKKKGHWGLGLVLAVVLSWTPKTGEKLPRSTADSALFRDLPTDPQ